MLRFPLRLVTYGRELGKHETILLIGKAEPEDTAQIRSQMSFLVFFFLRYTSRTTHVWQTDI